MGVVLVEVQPTVQKNLLGETISNPFFSIHLSRTVIMLILIALSVLHIAAIILLLVATIDNVSMTNIAFV